MVGDVELAEVSHKKSVSSEASYDDPIDAKILPESKKGLGSGKCGLYEINIGIFAKKPIVFNPVSSVLGAAILWGFTIWCMQDEKANETLGGWQDWVTETFTWLYIGSQGIWIFFLFYLFVAWGSVKLGKPDEKPESDNTTYFAMIFSAGVAVGLFVYGTAEPLYHYDYWYKNRFNGGAETDIDKAQHALNLTLFIGVSMDGAFTRWSACAWECSHTAMASPS